MLLKISTQKSKVKDTAWLGMTHNGYQSKTSEQTCSLEMCVSAKDRPLSPPYPEEMNYLGQ